MHNDVIFYINIACEYLSLIIVISATASRHLPDTIFISKRIRVTLQYILYNNFTTQSSAVLIMYSLQVVYILLNMFNLRLSVRSEFKFLINYQERKHTILIINMVITKSICTKLYKYINIS